MNIQNRIRRKLAAPYALPSSMAKGEFIRMWLKASVNKTKMSFWWYDPLTLLATKYRSDKGVTHFPFHGYTLYYSKLFEAFRNKEINMLEIGLARRGQRGSANMSCPSLNMWVDYFPKANIFGLDIDDFTSVKLDRARIYCGDQGNPADLLKPVEACSEFDIIIDDGSHASYHQQITLKTLFPYLKKGGLYIIEDLHWQPESLEASLPAAVRTKTFLKNRSALDEIATGVGEVHFFRSPIEIDNKADIGELAVISKV